MTTRYGAGGGTRTHTESPPADFESATSTIPSHRLVLQNSLVGENFGETAGKSCFYDTPKTE